MWQLHSTCHVAKPVLRPQHRLGSVHERLKGVSAQSRPGVCAAKLNETETAVVINEGEVAQFPASAGVYAVYDGEDALQYVGLSRKISMSIAYHRRELPELTQKVKIQEVADSSRDSLTRAWKEWVEEALAENGALPPGNLKGEQKWKPKKPSKPRPEIRLTPGKGIDDLTCSMEELVDKVVKDVKVLAFIKGTRTEPQCGFSYQMLTILNREGVDYELLNVLDEQYNPGLRETVKTYSEWPTIPQLYVNGEFVGGSDIVNEMSESGELAKVLKA